MNQMESSGMDLPAYIATCRWQESKDKSHSYTLRAWFENRAESDPLFDQFTQHIRDHGYGVWFYGTRYTCFDVDAYRYWTMGWPLAETILINNALNLPGNPIWMCSPRRGWSGMIWDMRAGRSWRRLRLGWGDRQR